MVLREKRYSIQPGGGNTRAPPGRSETVGRASRSGLSYKHHILKPNAGAIGARVLAKRLGAGSILGHVPSIQNGDDVESREDDRTSRLVS